MQCTQCAYMRCRHAEERAGLPRAWHAVTATFVAGRCSTTAHLLLLDRRAAPVASCTLIGACHMLLPQIDASDRLRAMLDEVDPMEGEDDLRVRELCIRNLFETIREWIREVCIRHGMAEEDAHEVRARPGLMLRHFVAVVVHAHCRHSCTASRTAEAVNTSSPST
jgi:hypothetical protein